MTAMRSIYTGLAIWNLAILGFFAVLSVLRLLGSGIPDHAHQLVGFGAAFFCCLVQSLLIIHFIGSMKWIQQSGPTAGIEDTKPLRTAWIKDGMYPLIIACTLVAVAAAILSGGAFMGSTPPWVAVFLACLGLPLNAYALVRARRSLLANTERMRGVEARMEERIEQGLVAAEEDTPELRAESGRAGSRTLLFLAVNVWVLYVYRRFILRDPFEPLWPYLVACGVLAILGVGLLVWRPRGDVKGQPSA